MMINNELKDEYITIICNVLKCTKNDISDIETLKKGMTNRSYIFTVKNRRYIMRIPGEGTEQIYTETPGWKVRFFAVSV